MNRIARKASAIPGLLGYDRSYVYRFDTEGIQALSEDEDQRLRREVGYLDRGVYTVNEVRTSRGRHPIPNAG